MATSRTSSLRALRQLSSHQQARRLHILPHHPATPKQNAPKAIISGNHTFTTSRTQQTRNDTSTMDFAYLPMESLAFSAPADVPIRVPLLHNNYNPPRTGAHAVEPESGLLLSTMTAAAAAAAAEQGPAVSTVAGDGTHWSAPSAMSDVDTANDGVDFAELARGLKKAVGDVEDKVAAESGVVRQLWEGVLDDLGIGGRKSGPAA